MGNYMNSEIPLNFKENPYTRTEWQDDVQDPLTGEIIEIGTTYMAEYANNFEWGIYNAYRFMIEMYRQMERMRVRLELDGRVPGNSGTFADTLDGNTNKIKLDKTMTEIIEAVEKGSTVLKVASVEGFTIRTQVTIYDNEHSEDLMITEVGAGTITVSALAKSYKKGAKVARSNVGMDYAKAEIRFGEWQIYNVELMEVL